MRSGVSNDELNNLQSEAYDHLWNGRFRLALSAAEKVYLYRPDDSDAALCYAWALLENGNPAKAMDYANLAVELKGDSVKARVYRAFLLSRMSIYEGAIADIDQSIDKQKETLAWTYLNKARSYLGLKNFQEAGKALDLALIIDNGKNPSWKDLRNWINRAMELWEEKTPVDKSTAGTILQEANKAFKAKEYNFCLLAAQKILQKFENDEAELLELESMLYLFQLRPALKKAEKLTAKYKGNSRFLSIYNNLKKFSSIDEESEDLAKIESKRKTLASTGTAENRSVKAETVFYPNDYADIFSFKIFDALDPETERKIYYQQVKEKSTEIGAEIIMNNPFFGIADKNFNCSVVWYLNDFEVGRNDFILNLRKDWDSIIFTKSWDPKRKFVWLKGHAKAEFYINGFKAAEKKFPVANKFIEETSFDSILLPGPEEKSPELKSTLVRMPDESKSLEELLAELDGFIGLKTIKEAIRSFISYLEFLKERKRLGLKAEESISVNSLFLGNPGTGKTTVARLLGGIFKAMGILSKGHVVEVDRAALVGQYVGETAQKTDKIINDAIGGVLFIDEAYTLVKKGGSGQDFGQEAVDILLKRMEDRRGEFVVIAAGYPEEMNIFMNSNPGLKSRFSQTFVFEDYTPDELMQIFNQLLSKEEYKITPRAEEALNQEFIHLYRRKDKSFGNARLVRQFFEMIKLNLSKRYLLLPENEHTKENMTTFTEEDVSKSFARNQSAEVKIPINEQALTEAMDELEALVGLTKIKKEINDLVKLARYFIEQGEDIKSQYNDHILFLGNPGTGKTTLARIFSKIYSALGILKKGHLVETDRQGLVAGYVGQTAEKTTSLIDKALGGTLFIDEAYALIKKGDSGNDFGKEAVDILLKRMEDDRGKFVVIAAGYTDEMNSFIASNPGLQSRFTKSYLFEDYSPEELMEIVLRSLKKEKKEITDEARKELQFYFHEIYDTRDKKFGNARIVRNILETAKNKMLLRLADLSPDERTEKIASTIELSDISEIVSRGSEAREYNVKGDPLKLQGYINELNLLIGLDQVKHDIYKLLSGFKISLMRKERGMGVIDRNLNAVFMGKTGTGKKMIAQLYSRILKELGLLEKGHLVTVDRADLIANYQGQTAVKTDRIIQQALGGTLFVENAYSLFSEINDFGQEALETILKRMGDYSRKLVVILAGNHDDMSRFLETNIQLKAHFPNLLHFEDYNPRELLGIASDIAEKSGYQLDEGALQEMLELFSRLYSSRDRNFENARVAKNVLYMAISFQEERISGLYEQTDEDLSMITLEDVQNIKI